MLLFFTTPSFSSTTQYSDSYFQTLHKKIQTELEKGHKKKADFWMARYLGVCALEPGTGHGVKDLEKEIKKRGLEPTAFLSKEYDLEFVDWFVKSAHLNWSVADDRVRDKSNAYEIQNASTEDKYFVTLVATPEIQSWFIEDSTNPLILSPASYKIKPVFHSGKLVGKEPTLHFPTFNLDLGKRHLLYAWPLEFYDLEGDGVLEIWSRFNASAPNGFSQFLYIFKIVDDSYLVLFKKFQADSEGFARRTNKNKVEIGIGIPSEPSIPHMKFDQHLVEVWEFEDGDFKKISTETIPHILKSKQWKRYYGLS